MTLAGDIKTIAVVNRSLVKEADKKHNVIEAVTTAEVAGSDKRASDECLKAVFDRFNGYNGMSVVIPAKTHLYGTGTRETPEILSWDTVQKICSEAKADVLLVLENFDSNSDLAVRTVTNQVGALVNGQVASPVPQQIQVNVISYWRLYDVKTRKIIDQYQTSAYLTFEANAAGVAVPAPEALPQAAYSAGVEYIQRFLPSYYSVRRDMYKRGKGHAKQEFLRGFRYAEVADWDGAMKVWGPLTNEHKRKNAGRACLNMAVACEVKGDFQGALEWAQKAYFDYRDKVARDYVGRLKYRISVE